jgi:hypothetical protein
MSSSDLDMALKSELLHHAVDGRNPQLREEVNIPLFIEFQPSVWWCRISQPSTICLDFPALKIDSCMILHRNIEI